MKKHLIILYIISFIFSSCSMEGAIQQQPAPGNKDETENPIPENPDEGPDKPIEKELQLLSSIRLKAADEQLFTREENEFVIEWPDSLGNAVSIQSDKECEISNISGNSVRVLPYQNGPFTLTVIIGDYYNTFTFEAYDKLLLEVISEYKGYKEVNPIITIYTFDVFIQLTNKGIPVTSDKYDIECEYQQTMATTDTYQTFNGRIGINEPLFISADATRERNPGGYLKLRRIRVSGITDTYTVAAPGQVFTDHFGDAVLIEFVYE